MKNDLIKEHSKGKAVISLIGNYYFEIHVYNKNNKKLIKLYLPLLTISVPDKNKAIKQFDNFVNMFIWG